MKKILLALGIVAILATAMQTDAARTSNYWNKVGNALLPKDSSYEIGSASTPIANIYATDMTVAGAFTLSGTMEATYDTLLDGMGVYQATSEEMEKYDETIVTTFQSGHGYTYTSGNGSSSDDTDAGDFVIGSQSLKIMTDDAGTQTRVTKTGITPFSIEDKNIMITAKIDDTDTLDGGNQQVYIGFSSDDFATTNFYQYYNANYALRKTEPGGEWLTMSFTAPDYVGGSPDLENITAIRIYLRGTGVTTLNINKISLVDKPKQAIITFTFDDGSVSQYDEGKKHLSKYGFPATAYVIRDRETDANYLSLAQMTELQDVHGWDISSHSSTNFTTLTSDEMETEMLAIKNYLLRNGFKGGDHLAYVQGELNSNIVLPLMRKYFTTGRLSAAGQQEALPVGGSPYVLKPFSMRASISTATIQDEIDQAIEEKSWLIFVSHKLVASGASDSEYNIADFQTVVDYVKTKVDSGDVKVRTMSEVYSQNPNAVETVDGKVGIGTSSPDADLHINGTTASELRLQTTGAGDPTLNFLTTNTANNIKMYLDESETNNHLWVEGITSGIDMSFNVKAPSGENAIMSFYEGSNRAQLTMSSGSIFRIANRSENDDIRFQINDGGSEYDLLSLDASVGYVGISDTSPGTKLEVNGRITSSVDADTIADSGGAGVATHNLTPTTSYVNLTCSDADGCDVTMVETGAVDGMIIKIVNSSANVVNFADTAGVSELAGVFAMGQWDSLELLYVTDRFVEISRSGN